MTTLPRTPEWRNVDARTLREEIIPRDRPAVLKGLVGHWPILRAAAESPRTLFDYIRERDLGRPLRVLVGPPEIKGFFFYRDDLRGLNFEFTAQPFHAVLARILECMQEPAPPALYTGAASVANNFRDIGRENTLEILDRTASGWLWLGNTVTMPTHYDPLDGINCIIAGRKRFTFFPPDQLVNLYVGPLEHAPGGQPTSLVRLQAPDLERFPRFAHALAVAEVAEVEPGDAVFLPNLWWHNVESLDPLNLSMNFWWYDAVEWEAEPFAALALGLLAITPLPASRREAWRAMFDHYVFRTKGDPIPYVPPDYRGMLGPMTPALAHQMRTLLIKGAGQKDAQARGRADPAGVVVRALMQTNTRRVGAAVSFRSSVRRCLWNAGNAVAADTRRPQMVHAITGKMDQDFIGLGSILACDSVNSRTR